jgi:hypothetical protein
MKEEVFLFFNKETFFVENKIGVVFFENWNEKYKDRFECLCVYFN